MKITDEIANVSRKHQKQKPTIVRYTQSTRNGTQVTTLHRHAVGYVMRGKRYLYCGDERREVRKGDVYYLGIGSHYIEDIPESNKTFEQIVFYYDSFQVNKILNTLSLNYQLDIRNDHDCPDCRNRGEVSFPAWGALRNFFASVVQYLADDFFEHDNAAEIIKMTELAYLIVIQPENCLKKCLLDNIDASMVSFEQIVHDNIFNDITIDDLARKCGWSLTSFKKEFRRRFDDPPHKWFIRQRLTHARLQLISTGKSVADIGNECGFPNTSHFIKLFKKEYRLTPVSFRRENQGVRV